MRKDLEDEVNSAHEAVKNIEKIFRELTERADTLQKEISTKESALEKLGYQTEDDVKKRLALIDELRDLNLSIEEANNILDQKSKLAQSIADEIKELEAQKEMAKVDTDNAIAEIQVNHEEIQRDLNRITKMLEEKVRELEDLHKEEDVLRQDFATWQRSMEERDRNLRIREEKVSLDEQKIARNSNLLNM